MNIHAASFENLLIKALREGAYLLPESQKEMEAFDKSYNDKNFPPLPEDIKDAEALLKRGYSEPSALPFDIDNNVSSSIQAMAARSGKKISDDILARMKHDRDNAQEDK